MVPGSAVAAPPAISAAESAMTMPRACRFVGLIRLSRGWAGARSGGPGRHKVGRLAALPDARNRELPAKLLHSGAKDGPMRAKPGEAAVVGSPPRARPFPQSLGAVDGARHNRLAARLVSLRRGPDPGRLAPQGGRSRCPVAFGGAGPVLARLEA